MFMKFLGPASWRSWVSASTKGMLSISPTVPPSSMIHTSGSSLDPSTGTLATRLIQSLMAFVTCGTLLKSANLPGVVIRG